MAKASPIQTNFTAGELSPRLDGRTDVAKYDNGCKTLENMLVHPQGGATRRPGTKFIGEVSNSNSEHRLIPFEFNVDQTYAVEFGDKKARLVTNDGLVTSEERKAYDTDVLLNTGWGITDSSEVDTYVHFSDDGLKAYFVKVTEDKGASTHTLEFAIRQYALSSEYDLLSAGTLEVERTYDLPDRYSSNVPEGQRRLHCGMFFQKGSASDASDGACLYIWDGIPTADISQVSTSHTDCAIYKFDCSTAFDLTGTSSTSDITSAADATYNLGASNTISRYPIPICGVGITPRFVSIIEGEDYAYWGINDSQSTNSQIARLDVDPDTRDTAGRYLHLVVSHLLAANNVAINGYSADNIDRYKLLHVSIDTGIGSGETGFSWTGPAFTNFPYYSNAQEEYLFVNDVFVQLIADSVSPSAKGYITGLQVRATNNYWIADQNGNFAHTDDFVPAGENYNTSGDGRYLDLDSGSTLDVALLHRAPLYVFSVTYLSTDGERVGIIAKNKTNRYGTIWTVPGVTSSYFTDSVSYFKLSEKQAVVTPGNTSDWGAIRSFMQYDGKKIWFSDGTVSDGVTNIATALTLTYPYIGLAMDDSLLETGESFPYDWYSGSLLNLGATRTFSFDYEEASIATRPILEVSTPFTTAQLPNIKYAQSADVLFLAHPDVPLNEFVRFGATTWSCRSTQFTRGPMQDISLDGSTLTASGRSGSVTVTSSDGKFQITDVGRLIKLHDGYAKITAFSSDTSVTATVLENEDGRTELMPSYTATTISAHEGDPDATGLSHNDRFEDSAGNFIERGFKDGMRITVTGFTQHANNNEVGALIVSVTADTILIAPGGDLTSETAGNSITIVGDLEADDEYRLGAFSETTGYPSVVTLYEQRLILGNTLAQPQTLFFSSAGLFTDFTPGIDATDGITYTLSSNQVNVIQYLVGARLLVVGTSGGEFSVSSGGTSEPLTPTNIQIRRQSNYGGSTVQPFTIGSAVLFVQRAERKLRELVYDFDTDSYFAPDLTLLSEHLTEGLIKEVAWQQEPDGILWARLGDGSLIGLTYRREEEVIAWHRHTIAGSGFIESLISLPSRSGEDELYMIVKRTINGATKRYIERLSEIDNISSVTDPKFLDSHLTYSGAAVNSLSGLSHLEGETVSILANGAKHADKTVSSGSISLDVDVTDAVVGYKYSSTLETMRIDAGGTEGTSQGKTKRIRGVTARFLETSGAQIGPDTSNLKPIVFAEAGASATTAIPLYTGDKYIEFSGNYETDGFIVVKQDDPLPMTVLALMPLLQTFDR